MGHLGFSYIGLIYLLMLFIPNSIWAKNRPKDYDAQDENKLLLILERVGQVCVTACALIFDNYNPSSFSLWSLWLIASIMLMLLYELFWVRYFRGGHTQKDFYGKFFGIPIPGASLPVAAFLLLGIYGRVVWLIISVIILGIGHIGIHIQHLKELNRKSVNI